MFRSLKKPLQQQKIEISINNKHVYVDANSSVWAALALTDQTITRLSPVSEQPRSAYCAMGVCFECLVEIDQIPNRQACLTQVHPGMEILQQHITQTSQAQQASNINNDDKSFVLATALKPEQDSYAKEVDDV
jgi:hypothetical protein